MANPIVRPAPIRVDGDKIADATKGSWRVNAATKVVPNSDGGIAITRGVPTLTVQISTIVPVKGMRVRLMEACLAQREVEIEIFADAKGHKSTGVFSDGGYDWEYAGGELNGDFTFVGAKPDTLS